MAINSIYNIGEFNSEVSYQKNDIVQGAIFLGEGTLETRGIHKQINYYYALQPSLDESPFSSSGKPKLSSQYWGGHNRVNKVIRPQFIWKPSYNATVEHAPRVIAVSFGNGYEQRSQDGIYNGCLLYTSDAADE